MLYGYSLQKRFLMKSAMFGFAYSIIFIDQKLVDYESKN